MDRASNSLLAAARRAADQDRHGRGCDPAQLLEPHAELGIECDQRVVGRYRARDRLGLAEHEEAAADLDHVIALHDHAIGARPVDQHPVARASVDDQPVAAFALEPDVRRRHPRIGAIDPERGAVASSFEPRPAPDLDAIDPGELPARTGARRTRDDRDVEVIDERGPGRRRIVERLRLHGRDRLYRTMRPMTDERADSAERTRDLPAADRVDADNVPLTIGNFAVYATLGEGGMGVVYAARDVDLDRPAAVKVVKPELDQPEYRARLLREAVAMARLEHPNVVKVYGAGTDGGRLFIAMELVDGTTLDAWLGERRTWAEIVAMFAHAGAGLAAVHRAGLVHRDFKPQNVLVDRQGRPRVADFGIARVDNVAPLTRTGAVVGTPGYMAPEQVFGRAVDARADQYSYCVALHKALVDAGAWLDAPPAIRRAIQRGLAHEPTARFESMDELLAALAPPAKRRGLAIAIAATMFVAAGATIAGIAATRTTPEPQLAITELPGAPADAAASHDADSAAPTPIAGSASPPVVVAPRPHTRSSADAGVPEPAAAQDELTGDELAEARTAISGLGYIGLTFGADIAADVVDVQTKLDAAAPDDAATRGALLIALGAAERKRGDCGAAATRFAAALDAYTALRARDVQRAWYGLGDAHFGLGLCQLWAGHARAALAELGLANSMQRDERAHAETHLAHGIALRVTGGDRGDAFRELARAQTDGSEVVRRALAEWAKTHPP
jgi:predicted Ser/Thr protein kinase